MSCLPHLNKNAHVYPQFYTWPWFQRNYSLYEPVIFSVVPCYFHPSIYLSTPEVYHPAAIPPLSPVAFSEHQSERSYNSYYTYTPAEMNACKTEVLEKTSTVHSSSGNLILLSSN